MKIQIIFASTRDGRQGEKVAKWVLSLAKQKKDVEFEYIDLKQWNLPFYNDPIEPSEGKYSYDYTKKWSEKISEGEGYIIVTPEYNHGYPAPLKNALDLLYKEWNKKPVAFVSYGGSAGGARAVEQLKQVVLELQMVPIYEAVHLYRFFNLFDEEGNLKEERFQKAADKLLDSLIHWVEVLRTSSL